jgi:AraC-like DNA-binding protein
MANGIEKRPKQRARRVADDVAVDRPVAAWAGDYAPGIKLAPHRHSRAQLVYAAAGVMNVSTVRGTWVVPPSRAVWVPAETEHGIAMSGTVAMRTIYVRKAAARGLPKAPCVLNVSPLLRELIMRAVVLPPLYEPRSADGRVMAMILDEIKSLPVMPLELRMPRDPRLLRLCSTVLDDPGGTQSFGQLATKAGASVRTLARLFRSETGLTFSRWRQQARLMEALRRLAAGDPITTVALDLGYATPSAFTYMFRRALGVPPSRFYGATVT